MALSNRSRARASRSRCQRHRKRGSQTIWIADAHCDDRKRFVVRADEKLLFNLLTANDMP